MLSHQEGQVDGYPSWKQGIYGREKARSLEYRLEGFSGQVSVLDKISVKRTAVLTSLDSQRNM